MSDSSLMMKMILLIRSIHGLQALPLCDDDEPMHNRSTRRVQWRRQGVFQKKLPIGTVGT